MSRSPSFIVRLWHQIRVRPRLLAAGLAGAIVFAMLPPSLTATSRALLTWDSGAGLYLALAWLTIMRAPMEHMKWQARVQDDGAAVVLFLTVAAAIASLAAIVLELSGLKSMPIGRQGYHVGFVALTFAMSWLLVHTSFALHYAHTYYISLGQNGNPPLEFPRQEAPLYPDFLYFSMVIGMTSQTADVAICSTAMRRLVMTHGIVAFVFNTTLLALTINIAASLLN